MTELEKLKQIGFSFNKKYGQNFITDTNLLNAIVVDSGITKDDYVLEVGAGAGTLTKSLCAVAKNVTTFEIDKNLKPILDSIADVTPNLEVIYGDVLKHDIDAVTGGQDFCLVANLPYYITTPIIFHFLEMPNLKSITVMVQKEVAERFGAKANTPNYGAVTGQLRAYGEATVTRIVPRNMFTPPPNVDSAIVHLKIEKKEGVEDFKLLKKVIACAFAMRRKTLVNNLMSGFFMPRDKAEGYLNKMGLSTTVRGEVLDIAQYIALSNLIVSDK